MYKMNYTVSSDKPGYEITTYEEYFESKEAVVADIAKTAQEYKFKSHCHYLLNGEIVIFMEQITGMVLGHHYIVMITGKAIPVPDSEVPAEAIKTITPAHLVIADSSDRNFILKHSSSVKDTDGVSYHILTLLTRETPGIVPLEIISLERVPLHLRDTIGTLIRSELNSSN
jgi:hypothetical protein